MKLYYHKTDGGAEYYFNCGKEWAWHDIAIELGVELLDEDFKLIGEEA